MIETLKNISDEMANLVAASGSSIVRVEGRRRMAATGIIWRADGIIVTAHHVVERDDEIAVGLPGGDTAGATVVGRDPGADLAVLRIATPNLSAATWIADEELHVGNLVLAIGRPGKEPQATLGIVSALGTEWRTHAGGTIHRYLQTDVVMYPGFSGGPLVAADGRFAGMNTSGLTRGTSITIPQKTIAGIVETILTHGHVPRGYLGIGVQPVRLADAIQQVTNQETGLMVMSAEANGPAAKGGILQGDILIRIDDTPMRHVDELQTFLGSDQAGNVVTVQLLRGGAEQNLSVTVGQS